MTNVAMTPASVIGVVDWVNVSGATALASITDALDTSYVTDTGATATSKQFTVTWTNPALPDGAVIQQMTVTVRSGQASTNGAYDVVAATIDYPGLGLDGTALRSGSGSTPSAGGGTIYDYSIVSSSYAGTSPAPATVAAGITSSFFSSGPASGIPPTNGGGTDAAANDHRIYKISGVMNYVAAPTAASLAVVAGDLTTTTKPQHTYTYTSPDGLPQYELQAATWLVSDLANYPGGQAAFEADPEAAFKDIAGVGSPSFLIGGVTVYAAKGWTVDPDTGKTGRSRPSSSVAAGQATTWTPPQALPFSGAMKTYLRPSALFGNARVSRTNNAASGGVATVAFTMAVPTPPAATSVVATWLGASTYAMQVVVALPVHTSTRRVFLEHSADGGTTWNLVPVGSQVFAAAAGSATFYDTAVSPGRSMRYRARSAHPTFEAYSAYTNTAAGVTAALGPIILRDPLDAAQAATVLRWQGDWELSADEILGENRGLGAALPSVVSDAIGGNRWSVEAVTLNEAEYLSLKTLREKRLTLLLQMDMLGYWFWVRFGDAWSVTTLRQTQRATETQRTRRVRFSLIETFPLAGQPTPAAFKG